MSLILGYTSRRLEELFGAAGDASLLDLTPLSCAADVMKWQNFLIASYLLGSWLLFVHRLKQFWGCFYVQV